jgi:hypothetical protein
MGALGLRATMQISLVHLPWWPLRKRLIDLQRLQP